MKRKKASRRAKTFQVARTGQLTSRTSTVYLLYVTPSPTGSPRGPQFFDKWGNCMVGGAPASFATTECRGPTHESMEVGGRKKRKSLTTIVWSLARHGEAHTNWRAGPTGLEPQQRRSPSPSSKPVRASTRKSRARKDGWQ